MVGQVRSVVIMIFNIFTKKKRGKVYWVKVSKIKIPEAFDKSKIRPEKWKMKLEYFYETGELQSRIFLNKDYLLVDGYTSYKIAKKFGIKKVPVEFI